MDFNSKYESTPGIIISEQSDFFPQVLAFDSYTDQHVMFLGRTERSELYQIIIIKNGSGRIVIDGIDHEFSDNDLVSIAKDQVYSFERIEIVEGIVLLFPEESLNRYTGDLQWLRESELFNERPDTRLKHVEPDELEKILGMISGLDNELREGSSDAGEIIYNLLKTCLALCKRIVSAKEKTSKSNQRDRMLMMEFKQQLESDFKNIRSVQHYADTLSITPKKLNRVSLKVSGKQSSKVIEERILLEAKRLLLYTSDNVKEIGYSLGFTDPSNFNRYFKKYYGCTPEEYRNIHNGGF